MKIIKRLFIAGITLSLSLYLIPNRSSAQEKQAPTSVPVNTLDLLRKSLKEGTPDEKEAALDVIRDLKPIALIPDIIEAIEDSTELPRRDDTGWWFVGHQAATTMGDIARAIDGIDVETRGKGSDKYSFHNDSDSAGNLKKKGRLSQVRKNWNDWWQEHKNR